MIAKIALKILKRIKGDLTNSLKTPFDYEYKLVNIEENDEIKVLDQFKVQN